MTTALARIASEKWIHYPSAKALSVMIFNGDGMNIQGLRNRFESKFVKTEGCWEWKASKDPYGYGKMGVGSSTALAHRLAYELYKGKLAAGTLVCHTCDNPGCVNPEHLFAGTHSDNSQDMKSKRRSFSLLTPDQIAYIKSSSKGHQELATELGVSKQAIFYRRMN